MGKFVHKCTKNTEMSAHTIFDKANQILLRRNNRGNQEQNTTIFNHRWNIEKQADFDRNNRE